MARHCSLSAKATSLTTTIPAQKCSSSIEPLRCARARESRRQRSTSTFSRNESCCRASLHRRIHLLRRVDGLHFEGSLLGLWRREDVGSAVPAHNSGSGLELLCTGAGND